MDIRSCVLERPKQRAYLARYGRQDFWAARSVVDLDRAVAALSSVVEKENELNRIREDQ